jgi:hypothetical protein
MADPKTTPFRSQRKPAISGMCGELMKSKVIPGHIHTCTGDHDSGLHKCSDPDCRRWFGES